MRKHCKQILGMAVVSSMVLAGAANAATNLLLNPGFEANVNGSPDAGAGDQPLSTSGPWSGWNNWVAPYSGYYSAATAQSGAQSGKTFSGPNCGIFQYVTVTAGQTYTASAAVENYSGDAFTNAAQRVDVRMIFQDASNNTIETDVSTDGLMVGDGQNNWKTLSVTATAPAGAVKVQWMAFMDNPQYQGGSFFVDNASLTAAATPEPASLGLLGLAGVGLLRRRRV